jgi:hypothetical protein
MLAFQRAPPGFVGAVPRDGTRNPLFKAHLRFPAEGMQSRAIERVPAVVPEPVGDVFDVTPQRTPTRADQQARELEVG